MTIVMALVMAAQTVSLAVSDKLKGPTLLNPARVFTAEDYPDDIVRKGRGGYANFAVTVDPVGKIERCNITKSSGVVELDDLTCRLIIKRARFEPAADVSGLPTFGLFKGHSSWLVGPLLKTAPPRSADFALTVKHLPDGLKSPIDVGVAMAVDAAGTVSVCVPSSSKDDRRLVAVACAQIARSGTAEVAKDRSGMAVPSIQLLTIDFSD